MPCLSITPACSVSGLPSLAKRKVEPAALLLAGRPWEARPPVLGSLALCAVALWRFGGGTLPLRIARYAATCCESRRPLLGIRTRWALEANPGAQPQQSFWFEP